jgi:hypothetical protein
MARVFFRYLLPTERLQGVGELSGEASSFCSRRWLHVTFLLSENRGFHYQDANFALKLGSLPSEGRRSYLPDFL